VSLQNRTAIGLPVPFGEDVDLVRFRDLVAAHQAACVVAALSDAYDGRLNPIPQMGDALAGHDKVRFLVDASLGLAADEFRMDDWRVDIALSTSGSGLMAPLGLTLLAVRQELLGDVSRSAVFPSAFHDSEHGVPDCPSQLIAALDASTRMIMAEGLDDFQTHRREVADAFRRGVAQVLGFEVAAKSPSCACTTALLPADVSGGKILRLLRDEHGLLLTGWQAPDGRATLCIGHAGWVYRQDIYRVIEAIAVCKLRLEHQTVGESNLSRSNGER
jgi:aspartate aminotransferase-like enzyme